MLTKDQSLIITNAFLKAMPDVWGIYVFGSTVKGGKHQHSDIDLGFVVPQKPSGESALALRFALGNALNTSVDLVDMKRADCVTLSQILECGELIYNANPQGIATFEMVALSKYASLNEERREIIADIMLRGSIYDG